jgi:FkbM family methyltransferase
VKLICEPSHFEVPIAIVGAGGTSLAVLDILGENKKLVTLIVDNDSNLVGSKIEEVNLHVCKIEDLREFDGEILIACAGNEFLRAQLEDLGLDQVNYHYNYLSNRALFDSWTNNSAIFEEIVSELRSSESKESLKSIFTSVESKNFLRAFNAVVPTPFFGSQAFQIQQGERLVDVGSYRGRHLQTLTLGDLKSIEKVTLIEPDKSNNDFLMGLFSADDAKDALWKSKLQILNVAIKQTTGYGRNVGGGISNSISSYEVSNRSLMEHAEVEVISLNELSNLAPSLITVDVEGDEIDLLCGGVDLISKYRPRIAISTYHRPDHLELIYKFFKKFPGDKRYEFRLHDYGYMDQVLYVQFT